MEFKVRNANDLFSNMLWRFKTDSVKVNTRNGPALMINEPVLTQVMCPAERVLFFSGRDANPIFHLLESIWILAGRRDVRFVRMFNSRIGQYSDNDINFNAAYGWRMRSHWDDDQLIEAVRLLKRDPETRRCVIQLWDARDLTMQKSKDLACNTSLMFAIRDGKLEMTVTNRSNDAWFGYAGANIVHMTIIQEFVAAAVGVPMGRYYTVSNNLHLYTEMYAAGEFVALPPDESEYDVYRQGIEPTPILSVGDDWPSFLDDCEAFCFNPFSQTSYQFSFFNDIAKPMAMVSKVRKEKSSDGREWAEKILAKDWRLATEQWIDRRQGQTPLFG